MLKNSLKYHSILLLILIISCKNGTKDLSNDERYLQDSIEVYTIYETYRDSFNVNYVASQVNLKQLVNRIHTSQFEYKLLPKILIKFIIQEIYAGNVDFCDSLTRIAIDLVPLGDSSRLAFNAYETRAQFFNLTDQKDSAIYYYDKLVDISQKCRFLKGEVIAKANLATIFSHLKNNDKSIELFLDIIKICEENDFDNIQAGVSNNLGNVYLDMGQLFMAMSYFQKSIDLYGSDTSRLLNPLNNLALIYSHLGMDSLAIDGFEKVVKISREYNNLAKLGLASNNLADMKINDENNDETIRLLREGYIEQKSKGFLSAYNRTHFYLLMAKAYAYVDEADSAIYYSNLAYKTSKKGKLNNELISSGLLLSQMYLAKDELDTAYFYAKLAYDTIMQSRILQNEGNLLHVLAQIHDKKGESLKALDYYERFAENIEEYIDTLLNKNTKDIAYSFEIQQREKQHILLEKEKAIAELKITNNNSTIKLQRAVIILVLIVLITLLGLVFAIYKQSKERNKINKALQEDNTFKNNLLSIVTHDLRSPLISLHSMLMLLNTDEIDEQTRERITLDLFSQTEKSIDLADNLLFWTREQLKGASINKELFSLNELLRDVEKNEISERQKAEVSFNNRLSSDIQIKSDKNIIHLVLRNLISNAFKFTPVGGTISVAYEAKEDLHVISVSDTGIGISNDKLSKVLNDSETISMKGVRGEKGKGFGLLLCKYFLQKCNGHIWFESELNKGTTFFFSIPK